MEKNMFDMLNQKRDNVTLKGKEEIDKKVYELERSCKDIIYNILSYFMPEVLRDDLTQLEIAEGKTKGEGKAFDISDIVMSNDGSFFVKCSRGLVKLGTIEVFQNGDYRISINGYNHNYSNNGQNYDTEDIFIKGNIDGMIESIRHTVDVHEDKTHVRFDTKEWTRNSYMCSLEDGSKISATFQKDNPSEIVVSKDGNGLDFYKTEELGERPLEEAVKRYIEQYCKGKTV